MLETNNYQFFLPIYRPACYFLDTTSHTKILSVPLRETNHSLLSLHYKRVLFIVAISSRWCWVSMMEGEDDLTDSLSIHQLDMMVFVSHSLRKQRSATVNLVAIYDNCTVECIFHCFYQWWIKFVSLSFSFRNVSLGRIASVACTSMTDFLLLSASVCFRDNFFL